MSVQKPQLLKRKSRELKQEMKQTDVVHLPAWYDALPLGQTSSQSESEMDLWAVFKRVAMVVMANGSGAGSHCLVTLPVHSLCYSTSKTTLCVQVRTERHPVSLWSRQEQQLTTHTRQNGCCNEEPIPGTQPVTAGPVHHAHSCLFFLVTTPLTSLNLLLRKGGMVPVYLRW